MITDSVIYAQNDLQEQSPVPQMPLVWPGPYAYMQMPQVGVADPKQASAMFDSRKYSTLPHNATTMRNHSIGHAVK